MKDREVRVFGLWFLRTLNDDGFVAIMLRIFAAKGIIPVLC